jgi:hypothetical protein
VTDEDPRAEIRKVLAGMKERGITIEYRPNSAGVDSYGSRAMSVIDEEARALDMTFESGGT